jgi:hypothetical protein
MATKPPSADVPARSADGKRVYENWDALVEAESNGWVAIAVLRERAPKATVFSYAVGPWPGPDGKRLATNAAVRIRKSHKKRDEERMHNSDLLTVNVRPLWKDTQ